MASGGTPLRRASACVSVILATLWGPAAVLSSAQPARAESKAEGERLHRLCEYLASECAACHRDGGSRKASEIKGVPVSRGIPPISGLDPGYFIGAMSDYRNGRRDNPIMASVARSLSEEQVRALAAYFQHTGRKRGKSANGRAK